MNETRDRSAMAEIPLRIGADAMCADGVCGKVSRVVVDPVARVVSHLVVQPRHWPGLGRLVPLDLVDAATPNEVRLRCTRAEFDGLGFAEDAHFAQGTSLDRYADYSAEQMLMLPYYSRVVGEDMAQTREDESAGAHGSLPPGEVGVRRNKRLCHRRRDRASRGACHRPWEPPCEPRAAARGACVWPQASGHPDPRRYRGHRRRPAQHHQAAGGEPAAREHRLPQRVAPPGGRRPVLSRLLIRFALAPGPLDRPAEIGLEERSGVGGDCREQAGGLGEQLLGVETGGADLFPEEKRVGATSRCLEAAGDSLTGGCAGPHPRSRDRWISHRTCGGGVKDRSMDGAR